MSIERLLVEQACRDLVLQAAAHADSRDADALAALFLADGVLVRPTGPELHGRAAIRDSYATRPAGRITRHMVTNSVVEIEMDGRARVRSHVLLWIGSEADEPGPKGRPIASPLVLGEFDDQLSLTLDGWRIARRDAHFLLHAP
jgi:uncharacterized protein (TIGR02246 family)